jgi:site-specific recombinase XerD
LKNKNYSPETISHYSNDLKYFFKWFVKNDIREVTRSDIFTYIKYLKNVIVTDKRCKDNHFSKPTQMCKVKAVKMLFKYLLRHEYILVNPFDSIDLKVKKRYKLRKSIDINVMNRFLDSIDKDDVLSIRNRALYELMYGTGLRVGEIVKLDVTDIDLNLGKALVREGKGKKDRIIPLGNNVINKLKIYLKKSRKYFLKRIRDTNTRNALFLSLEKRRLSIPSVRLILKKYFKKLNISDVSISPHVVRHSFATHMLEGGAGIKYVKDILGHTSVQTTVIYTHFSVKSLKRIMKMYHPRENELYEELKEDTYKKIIKE